ncbi:hypothetical protein Slin14017_G086120 [Septoria linicola]|nr:hypothetical protein Slin14017_G086120 [Septoria linicola]
MHDRQEATCVISVWDSGLLTADNEQEGIFVVEQPFSTYTNTRGWEVLPVTDLIGLPLRARPLRDYSGFTEMVRQLRKDYKIPPIRPRQDKNQTIALLSLEPDVTSPILNSPRITADCDVVVARVDGQSLTREVLCILEHFIDEGQDTAGAVLGRVDLGKDARQKLVEQIFSPEMFVALFEGMRDERVKALKRVVGEGHPELQR